MRQKAVGHRVEGTAPDARCNGLADDLSSPANHLGGRPAGKGQQHDLARAGPLPDQAGDAGSERLRFPGACARYDAQRPGGMLSGGTLLWVEVAEEGIRALVPWHR